MTPAKTRRTIVGAAKRLVGKPYKYGAYLGTDGDEPDGFDCSSFTQYVYQKAGIDIPRSSILQAAGGIGIDGLEENVVIVVVACDRTSRVDQSSRRRGGDHQDHPAIGRTAQFREYNRRH